MSSKGWLKITSRYWALCKVYLRYTDAAEADIVITVTSSIDSVINADDIKSGAVICDVHP